MAAIYAGVSFALVPVNHAPPGIRLDDVCVVLEAAWRFRCEVLAPMAIPQTTIFDARRQQYKADAILDEVERRLPHTTRRHTHVLAITESDIFGAQTAFVFSWQQGNETGGVGVLSTARFVSGIPGFYEPDIVPTRRVALQAVSTRRSVFLQPVLRLSAPGFVGQQPSGTK